jgi:UDP-glucose 4-epimerase
LSSRVLVTGGSGFIGSHVVDSLVEHGYVPVNFDRVESPHHARGSIEYVKGDCTDVAALERAMATCDAVIHLAAMADVNDVEADPVGADEMNARATAAVLEAARRSDIGRVVYGSTIWAYSDCPEGEVDEHTRLEHPGHLYTATKLAGEMYCRSYAELYGLDYTILRFGIPYGPRARDATVVAVFVKKALAGEPLTVAGSGAQSRQFVYVRDLADGVVRALAPRARNRIYNLAGSRQVSILEIAQTVQEVVGDTEIVHTEARNGDFAGRHVHSERALEELGWEGQTSFEDGVRGYLAWRLEREEKPVPKPVARRALERIRRRATAARSPIARRRLRPVLTTAVLSAGLLWSFASDDSFTMIAQALGGKPTKAVRTTRPEVGLIVDAPGSIAPQVASQLARTSDSSSIAMTQAPSAQTLSAVARYGSDVVPQLKPGGPVRWIGTPMQLHKAAKGMKLHGHLYYAAPGKGFTLGQALLAHIAHGSAVAPAVSFTPGRVLDAVKRGQMVRVTLSDSPGWKAQLAAFVLQLHGQGLHAVPAAQLVADPD